MDKSRISELEKKAEEVYPMPLNACVYVRKRIAWLRERWVNQQMKSGTN